MYKETKLPLYRRELFIYRLINNYIKYKTLQIRSPTPECIYEASYVYDEVYNDALMDGALTEAQLIDLMIENEEWSEYQEKQLSDILPKHVGEFQRQIYNNFSNKKLVNQIYLYLNKARQEINNLFNIKVQYNYMTAEGTAIFAKLQYIIKHSTFENNKLCDWQHYDIRDVIQYSNENYIDDNTLRYLARQTPWSEIWSSSKKTGQLFQLSAVELSDEQRRLISWSTMYDNIRDMPDCPSEEIINCDDALDGWLLIKQDERNKERNLNTAEDALGINKNAPEVFVVTPKEEVQKVYDLNSPMSRAVVQSRLDTINKLGQAKEDDFADTKQKLNIMRTQAEIRK